MPQPQTQNWWHSTTSQPTRQTLRSDVNSTFVFIVHALDLLARFACVEPNLMRCAPALIQQVVTAAQVSFRSLVKETMCFPPNLVVAIAMSQQSPQVYTTSGVVPRVAVTSSSRCSEHNSGSVLGSEKYRHRISPSEHHLLCISPISPKVNITAVAAEVKRFLSLRA